jgi:hypothetical protein
MATRCRRLLKGFARSGSINQRRPQPVGRCPRRREIDRHQRSLRKRRATAGRPHFAKVDHEATGDQRDDVRFRRQRQFSRPARVHKPIFGLEERQRAANDERPVTGAIVERRRANADVGGRSTKDFHRGRQRLPALNALDDERIAGARELAGRPFAGDEQRVGVLPGGVLLAARKRKAAVDESARPQIEFAHCDCILAAVGQADQAATLGRLFAIGAAPEPVRLLRGSERVEIQDRRPRGSSLLIIGEAGPPPDSAHVIGVLPAVEDPPADQLRQRDSVLGLGDLERCLEKTGVAGIVLEHGGGLRILRTDPRHRAFTIDLLEPHKRIVARDVGVGGGRRSDDREHCGDGDYRAMDPHVLRSAVRRLTAIGRAPGGARYRDASISISAAPCQAYYGPVPS